MIVTVPGSSANLGPGFDALGMAVGLYARFALSAEGLPERARVVDEHHPALVAFRRLGGEGELWVQHSIPGGRGLGFSGAMRVGGAALALVQRDGAGGLDRAAVLDVAAELEGHADNAAASVYGGIVATAAGRVVQVPLAVRPAVVVWIPTFTTATDKARRQLGGPVPFDDAVFNIGRTALLVAALAAGDVDSLRVATEDRLHQDARFGLAEPSRAAYAAALDAGAWCAWLSGSGPTIAALCAPEAAARVAAALPEGGETRVLAIDHRGVTVATS